MKYETADGQNGNRETVEQDHFDAPNAMRDVAAPRGRAVMLAVMHYTNITKSTKYQNRQIRLVHQRQSSQGKNERQGHHDGRGLDHPVVRKGISQTRTPIVNHP